MQRPQLLDQNNLPHSKQLNIARILLFVFTTFLAFNSIRELNYKGYLTLDIGIEYIYLKIFLLAIILLLLALGLFSSNIKRLMLRFNFLFNFALFYLIAITIYIEGFSNLNTFYLLSLSILTYFIFLEFREVFYYVLFTNTTLVLLILFPRVGEMDINYDWFYYLLISIGLCIIKYYDYKHTVNVLNSDYFFKKVFNAINETILLLDPNTFQIQFFNITADRIFGIRKSDYIRLRDMVSEGSYTEFEEALDWVYKNKELWEGELELLDKNKKKMISKVTISYLNQAEKETLLVKTIDITKAKLSEQKAMDALGDLGVKNAELVQTKMAVLNVLQDINVEKAKVLSEQQKLQAILQSIAEGVVVIDKDEKIYMFNNTFLNMLGYVADEMKNRTFSDVVTIKNENTGEDNSKEYIKVFETGEILKRYNVSQFVNKKGDVIDVNETYAPIMEGDKVKRVVAVFTDATQQRKIEKLRKEFVSLASHQLRTPLTAISWYLEMLMDPASMNNLNEEQRGYLDMVLESNKKMIYLVNELLDISRIEGGKELDLIKSRGSIVELIDEVLEEQGGLIEQKSIKIDFNRPQEGGLIINMDKEKIRQVLMNIINNAIKYSKVNGIISINVNQNGNNIYIGIRDYGIGIPKSEQPRVFDKFFRAENAVKMQAQGTGLGLYVANEIIKRHGGKLEFESEENNGTIFSINLPTD